MLKYLGSTCIDVTGEDDYYYYCSGQYSYPKYLLTDIPVDVPSLQSDFLAKYLAEEVHHSLETLHEYYRRIHSNHDLNISPEYQRGIVWSIEDRQRFIMSLFNNTYTGIIVYVLNHNNKYRYELVDGKQRLTALFDFIESKYPLANGYYFKDLCAEDKTFLLNYGFLCKRIRGIGADLALTEKVNIFLQLNSGVSVSRGHLDIIRNTYLTDKE